MLARLKRLEEHYEKHGMRRTCEGILVCHEHNHPHVLMLQIANAFFKLCVNCQEEQRFQEELTTYRPGDYLPPNTDELPAFTNLLNSRLAPTNPTSADLEWQIGDCLAQWWRPNHETFLYPFLPAHCTRPKELKKLYFIHLPPTKILSVPKNMKLLAVPLFELYDNTARYGPQLSAIPHYLSRYRFEFVDEEGRVRRIMPGGELLGGGGGIKVLVGDDQEYENVEHKKEEDDEEVDMKHIKAEIGNVEGVKVEENAD